ncbi:MULTISPECIES: response regulator [Agrobacterium]|uniref:response regulator n=1 Tax=Agrobacterium TaxID=357 RepID=UPI00035EBBB2|nr:MULTISPECIES: response regulator [Agrobacterium]MDP9759272.1 DNA-binding response OmpR family regulator [Agrobacterium tumefaciens]MDQ1223699.1 DNA-binding response OmpR family regulator [Agrobacterium sp. SORGH_AS_0745]MEA1843492.1 response regulator [Agrobacterium tumefaciens]NTA46037.1 response regulator [Agrobacterium tumefaciens]UXU08766.1 response regulator [Agrobacterium tumefaciens]
MAQKNGHLLVVDDDARVRQLLTRFFDGEGYHVSAAADGVQMRAHLKHNEIDAILLDLNLPGAQDGLDLAREVRLNSDVPIIMLSGRDDVVDRIVGIEIGADDYIAKPFHLREVHARLKSILRRRLPRGSPRRNEIFYFDGWTLDVPCRNLLSREGTQIDLTTGEFDMLVTFAKNPGRVLTRDFLLEETRARRREAFDRSIDAQVARLRRKIETNSKHPSIIKSVRGVGYVFSASMEEAPSSAVRRS